MRIVIDRSDGKRTVYYGATDFEQDGDSVTVSFSMGGEATTRGDAVAAVDHTSMEDQALTEQYRTDYHEAENVFVVGSDQFPRLRELPDKESLSSDSDRGGDGSLL